MEDAVQQLFYGFSLAAQPSNLLYALLGALLGTLVGVLPGLGPVTTIVVLLPVTYQVGNPLGAIIMLASIYYGAMYGGSTTAILLKVPGEAASVITCIDGYEMARRGRAGPALAIAAIGSFIAGTTAVVALTFVGPLFARAALSFGPPEYFALAVLGLGLCATLSSGPPVRGLCMALAGVLLGLVGVDTVTGVERLTFGNFELSDGIELVPMLMGLFGLGEILYNLEQRGELSLVARKLGRLFPSAADWRASQGPIARGSALGFFVGLIPGGGAILGSLLSYAVEKRLSKTPEEFGRGAIAGVAGPESANNAAASASLAPLLTLGIPGNAVTAVLFAGLLIQNVQPGPLMLTKHADVFWGVIASMYIGNVFLLMLNIPLVGVFVQLLRVRIGILAAFALLTVMAGVFSVNNDVFDMWVVLVFGIIGWFMKKTGFEPGPLVLAFVLGPILERAFRQSMLLSDGDFSIFVTRPISGTIFALIAILLVLAVIGARRHRNPVDDLARAGLSEDDDPLAAPYEGQGGAERETTEQAGAPPDGRRDRP